MDKPEVSRGLAALKAWCGRLSLKTRLIALMAGLFMMFIWLLAFFAITVLQDQFERVLSDQQYVSTRRLAAELDNKLSERVNSLLKVSAGVPERLDAAALDPFLMRFGALHTMFSGGIAVIGLDGKTIADYPVAHGRRGTYYGDRDYFRKAIETQKPYIDKPIIGRALKRPVLTISVPVFDGAGRLRAVMTGITDLTAPNFLGIALEPAMAGKGELFVVSPHDNLIVAASDARRAMTAPPARGANMLYDRFAGGFEGSGVGLSSQGIPKLYSGVQVPAAHWFVMSALPTSVAFGPVEAMRQYLYVLATGMTLLALLLIWWMTRRVFARLDSAGNAMLRMTGGQMPLAPLPGAGKDEVGQLIGNFNLLVEDRRRYETALMDSERQQSHLNRALRLLSDCNMALVHAEREQSLLDEICRLVVTRGGYLLAWVGYAEADSGKTVRVASQFGLDDGYLANARISWADTELGRGPAGAAIRTGTTQANQNFRDNPSMAPWREAAIQRGFQSSISLPLISEKQAFGALSIYSADPDSFADDEVRLLHEMATDLAFGIRTLRMRVQREAAEEKLAFLAHHDPLTHLPNRVLLRDRFDRAITSAMRDHACAALLVLDLDNFKQINDALGHEVGDQLLLRVVERLQRCIRDADTISRQSGDEFVILLGGVRDTNAVSRIAQSILDTIAEPFEIGSHTVTTSFSIGMSMYPNDGAEFDTLLRNADAALYHAKDNGRDTYHFFAATMNVDALARMQLHGNLRKAVKNGEFLLHYQPQIDLASGGIIGAEALVRWQRPEEGLISPGRFIPLAEESGLIVQIGEWVLQEACRQAKAWIDDGMAPLVVAVNLSAQQFKRGDVVATVAKALEDSGLPAALLELELTESILLQETGTVMETLYRLKKLGVQLSIDDFGTGYSSLAYLKKLAVDKLKIDQSFVRDVTDDADDAAIVKAVIQLGHALQLAVIAEGVETTGQRDFLHRHGCDQVQGYLVSHPLPASEFAKFAASLAPAVA